MGRIFNNVDVKGLYASVNNKSCMLSPCAVPCVYVVVWNNLSENKGTRDWNAYVNQSKGENIFERDFPLTPPKNNIESIEAR